jgi:hypothetical protein
MPCRFAMLVASAPTCREDLAAIAALEHGHDIALEGRWSARAATLREGPV